MYSVKSWPPSSTRTRSGCLVSLTSDIGSAACATVSGEARLKKANRAGRGVFMTLPFNGLPARIAIKKTKLYEMSSIFLHSNRHPAILPRLMSSKKFKVAALAGDGIGPEVMREAIKVLRVAEKKFAFQLEITEAPVGWAGIDAAGKALPDDTLALCRNSHAILFGSVGLPDRDPTVPREERPERAALLRLRREFGLFANLRPVTLHPALAHVCPLTKERQGDGIDLLVVRELTAGLYFGRPKSTEEIPGGRRAVDTMVYTTGEIERIAHVAFKAAGLRRKKVASIDKANVLENGVLWREVVTQVSKQY